MVWLRSPRIIASVRQQEELRRQFPPDKRLTYRVVELPEEEAGKDIWLVYPNSERPVTELRSSQLLAVCKHAGRVLYDGSAGDEG